jgi:hypothetical protein
MLEAGLQCADKSLTQKLMTESQKAITEAGVSLFVKSRIQIEEASPTFKHLLAGPSIQPKGVLDPYSSRT